MVPQTLPDGNTLDDFTEPHPDFDAMIARTLQVYGTPTARERGRYLAAELERASRLEGMVVRIDGHACPRITRALLPRPRGVVWLAGGLPSSA